jgi:hypothetical protein
MIRKLLFILAFCLAITTNNWSQTSKKPAGSGTEANPYKIATLENLYWLSQTTSAWGSYFIQTANIDASDSKNWNHGHGFSPIGYNRAYKDKYGNFHQDCQRFTGTYDGQGHTIHCLYIKYWEDNAGLFGVTSDSRITNLGLSNCKVSGTQSVGSLIGFMNGGDYVSNCFATGEVKDGYIIGGLVGEMVDGTIINCFSICSVSGSSSVGGLIGAFEVQGSVSNCYVSGKVSGDSEVGGFVGFNTATVSNTCFWDKTYTKTGCGHNKGSFSAVGETSGAMHNMNLFLNAGWDFASVWTMKGSSLPLLMYQVGSGTAASVSAVSINTIDATEAKVSASLTKLGVPDPYKHGFCYSVTDSNPTISDKVLNLGGIMATGSFSGTLTGLSKGYRYYVRAFATNAKTHTTYYSSQVAEFFYPFLSSGVASKDLKLASSCMDSFLLTGSVSYNIANNADWLVVSPQSLTASPAGTMIRLKASENPTGQERSATITFSAGTLSNVVVTVNQPADTLWISSPEVTLQEALGSKETVIVNSTIPWAISVISGSDWLKVSPENHEGNGVLTFTALSAVPYEMATRAARVVINNDHVITVTQALGIAPSGNGTSADPYKIATMDNLYWLSYHSDQWDKVYRQTADIDASGTSICDSGKGFSPIGNFQIRFTGTYHGNGHAIKNLAINRPATDFVGLFGMTYGAYIDSVGLNGGSISGSSYVGGLVGAAEASTSIKYCYATMPVSGTDFVGGLAGINSNYSNIGYSYATGRVKASDRVAGGLTGGNREAVVMDSYATSTVSGAAVVGGLVGENVSLTIQNCYATGKVVGTESIGGLIGENISGTARNCYWDIEGTGLLMGWGYNDGLIQKVSGLGTSAMQDSVNMRELGSFISCWQIRQGHTYPALSGIGNNAPFGFADTVVRNKIAYAHLLDNDDDYETGNKSLVLKIYSLNKGNVRDGYIYFPASAETGDTIQVVYRVGELIAKNDTLWGNEVTATLIHQENNIPDLVAVSDTTIAEDIPLTMSLTGVTATDADNDELLLVINEGPHYTVDGNTIIPEKDYNGTLLVDISVTDRMDTSNVLSMNVFVTPVNDAPVLTSVSGKSINEDVPLTLSLSDVTASDADDDVLLLLVNEGNNYCVSGTTVIPILHYYDTLYIPLSVTDGIDTSVVMNMILAIAEVNDAPVAHDTVLFMNENTAQTLIVPITDPDKTISTIYIDNPPLNGITSISGLQLTYIPDTDFTGSDTITWFAQDEGGLYSGIAKITVNVDRAYRITVLAADNGSISPAGTISVKENDSHYFAITSDPGYYISDVLVDNISAGAINSYVFTKVTSDHTLSATFEATSYILTASSGNHGSINPSGETTIAGGSDQTYTITADPGYHVSDVQVDNISVGPVTSYSFRDVRRNHTIVASFAETILTITAWKGSNGNISPQGETILHADDSITYTIEANPGYHVADVIVDGNRIGAVNEYTFTGVSSNHIIIASFAEDMEHFHTISASSGEYGIIDPSGEVEVIEFNSRSFNITADTGYQIVDVLVDGISIGAVSSYTFSRVEDNHTILAVFDVSTGIENPTATSVIIYPNPCTDGFTINAGAETTLLTVYDLMGNTVITKQIAGETRVSVEGLKSGVYLVRINETVHKIIVN